MASTACLLAKIIRPREMKMTKIRMTILLDTIKSLAVKDSKGKVIAYISVSGRNLMVSTEGWSDCTVEDITEMEELA